MDSNQKKKFCLAGRLYSNANTIIEYENLHPKTQKLKKTFKVLVAFMDETNRNFLQSK